MSAKEEVARIFNQRNAHYFARYEYSLDMLPVVDDAVMGMLKQIKEQRVRLEGIETMPGCLEDHEIDRIIAACEIKQDKIVPLLEQCRRWWGRCLSVNQKQMLQELELNIRRLEGDVQQLLWRAQRCYVGPDGKDNKAITQAVTDDSASPAPVTQNEWWR